MPSPVAIASARCGFGEPASVFLFIVAARFGLLLVEQLLEHLFIECRARYYIFLRGPVAQIKKAATFAAKWEVGVSFRICGFLADWALVLHMLSLQQGRDLNVAPPF